MTMNRKFRFACAAVLGAALASPALALKYAEPEHNLKVDPATPAWQPGKVPIPEDAKEWGDLGVKGEWASRPIHLYGLKPINGIEQYFKMVAMNDGEYREGIEWAKNKGLTHAFTVAAQDMAKKPGGLTYAIQANVTPNVKVLNVSWKDGDTCYAPTVENVYAHKYPFSRYVYIYVNKAPGKPLEPKVKEFLKLVLSKEGQQVVAEERVFIPLQPEVVKEELRKLE